MKLRLLLMSFLIVTGLFADSGKLYSVSDGDTITLVNDGKYTKARFDFYDTPEVYMTNKMAWDSYYCEKSTKDINTLGRLSSEYLKTKFKTGQVIEYSVVGYDGSGRALIVVDEFHKDIIKNGYAYVSKFHKDNQELIDIMNKARDTKSGLWGTNYQLMECLSSKALK